MNLGAASTAIYSLAVAVTALVAVLGLRWSFRSDKRADKAVAHADAVDAQDERHANAVEAHADVAEAMAVKQATIDGFRDQNNLLRTQFAELKATGEKREDAWREREKSWHIERAEFNKRVDGLSDQVTDVLKRSLGLGVCAEAKTCSNYRAQTAT
jgi:hypothetical protein